MAESVLYPRFLMPRLEEALADTPVLLIHGPRQSGKSTLARQAAEKHGHQYLTFDDDNVLQAAREDPVGFCAQLPGKVVLDEVQRIPELFTSIKANIDADRQPGRFILTGSANVMLLPALADSLAGRIEVLRLAPLAQVEIENKAVGTVFLDQLFCADFTPGRSSTRLGDALIERVLKGGFPSALTRTTAKRRQRWLREYVDALVQRDLRELTGMQALDAVPKLLEVVAGQTGRLFNASALASPFELSRPTIRDYLYHLERIFLIDTLQPWFSNRLSRLIKTPKVHLADTGLVGCLLGMDHVALKKDRAFYGQLLETFVYQEFRRQANWAEDQHRFYHYRDKDQVEVDVVIERNGRTLCGIEVKAGSTIKANDFRGLKRLRNAAGARFQRGVVLYDGDKALPFGDNLFAVPMSALWQTRL